MKKTESDQPELPLGPPIKKKAGDVTVIRALDKVELAVRRVAMRHAASPIHDTLIELADELWKASRSVGD
jgi:hypothetical protein